MMIRLLKRLSAVVPFAPRKIERVPVEIEPPPRISKLYVTSTELEALDGVMDVFTLSVVVAVPTAIKVVVLFVSTVGSAEAVMVLQLN
jgi:hypothetical protein